MKRVQRRAHVVVTAVLNTVCGLAATAGAQTAWSTAAGGQPSRNGSSGLIGPTAPTLLWQSGRYATIGQEGVCEGNVLVVPRWSDPVSGGRIVAYNLTTGAEMWNKQLLLTFSQEGNNRPTGMRDGRVYCTRASDDNFEYLYALDAQTGSQVWQSQDLITESYTESISFTDDGDIIASKWAPVASINELLRIRKSNGTTMWRANRSVPSSEGLGATVFGNTVYIWEASVTGPKISAFDAMTGGRKYSSASVSAGTMQRNLLMVGPDGTVYAARSENSAASDFFVAYTDTGTALVEKWRQPMGYTPHATHVIGGDGSVYTYETTLTSGSTTMLTIKRRDPITGAEMGASAPILCDYPAIPRMSADGAGRLYLSNGGLANGRLFSFNADLSLRWDVAVPRINTSGPIIGQGGVVVVCGADFDIRAFKTDNPQPCYANCDGGTVPPILNVNDFVCFNTRFVAGDSYANCDGSTTAPILNVSDFICFLNKYAAGCP